MAADDRLNEPRIDPPTEPPSDRPFDRPRHLPNGAPNPFEVLARRLRDAHRRVRALPVPKEERVRLTKRLLTICDAAKRDIYHANQRLETFIADLDGRSDTASGRNMPSGD
jgi:hypothetical protein